MKTRLHSLIIATCFATLIYGCQQEKNKTEEPPSKSEIAEAEQIKARLLAEQKKMEDKIESAPSKPVDAPVKILSSSIFKDGDYRNIKITFKNASGKSITGIKFSWKVVNAFNEPVDAGDGDKIGYGNGIIDEPIGVGQSKTTVFKIYSDQAKKIERAWPTEIIYSDGTKWRL